MKWSIIVAGCVAALAGCRGSDKQPAEDVSAARHTMHLTSPGFEAGATLPTDFTCDGARQSPPLQWSEPPAGTESFALIVEDPDAPGGTFAHWGVYDLPMSARQINVGAGEHHHLIKQTKNDFGEEGYGPPCPPKGAEPHHYHFRLLALDQPELAKAPVKVADILAEAQGHILATAELTALYGRD